jgi:hypothetical protein
MADMMKGFVDLHVHAGPSSARRSVDAYEVFGQAAEQGYRALVIKDHYFPTMMSTEIVQKHFPKSAAAQDLKIYGQIVLNNSQGGINLKAVDSACSMGVRVVTMPTVSARHHLKAYEGRSFVGGGSKSVPETPIYYLTEQGALKDEVVEILDYLAERPDVILATGHGSPAEIDVLVPAARKKGIRRILVNHPFCLVNASMEQMKRWAQLGAYIELNACDIDPISTFADSDLRTVGHILDTISLEQIVIDSDYGQYGNIDPVPGLTHFAELLMQTFGLSEENIGRVGKINPGWLLGLNEK